MSNGNDTSRIHTRGDHPADLDASPMTKAERADLLKMARLREKVAKAGVEQVKAERLADVEAQLSATYSASDEAWAGLVAAAERAAAEANAEVARVCRERGIPEEFRPRMYAGWVGRGRNAEVERRVELRKLAATRIDAAAKTAKHQIEVASAKVQSELLAFGLTTDAAKAFLESMPQPEALMPRLDVQALQLPGGRR